MSFLNVSKVIDNLLSNIEPKCFTWCLTIVCPSKTILCYVIKDLKGPACWNVDASKPLNEKYFVNLYN